jgi:hypothetical protein
MSRITISKNAAITDTPANAELAGESIARKANDSSERQAFYREYRQALKEYRAGRPERFEAFQDDPRIRPLPETAHVSVKSVATADSVSIVNAERLSLTTEAEVALISLMASVRSLSTTLGSLFR